MRTQIYLSPSQHRALRGEARKTGISLTELIRRIVDEHLLGRRGVAVLGKDEFLAFVALGRSGRSDGSERHDAALDEALRAGPVR